MAEPWERQKGESRQSFAAFCVYRDMGDKRSLQKVALEVAKSLPLMKRWSERDQWVARCDEWDAELDRIKRLARTKEITDMTERHAKLAVSVLNKVVARLIGDTANNVPAIDPASLSARDLATLLDIGVKVERLSRGEHSDSLEIGGNASRPVLIREMVVEMPRPTGGGDDD